MKNEYDYLLKIIIVGDSYVGKTNLLSNYMGKPFNSDSKATVGVEFSSKTITKDKKVINIQIWDTAGQERYKSIAQSYYRGANGAMVVYDITNESTFATLENTINTVKSVCGDEISIIICGNKNDLEDQRKVSIEEGTNKAKFFESIFFETSALNGDNVNKAFDYLIDLALPKAITKSKQNNNRLKDGIDINGESTKKGGCSC